MQESFNIKINKDFKGSLIPLSDEEFRQLEKNIIQDGCRDALVLWNGFLIDGYHRYKICKKNNISFKTIEKKFEDKIEVIKWITLNQLGRRNLTRESRTYIIGRLYKLEKSERGGDRKSIVQNAPLITAKKIADIYKVNESTVKRAENFANAVDKIAENFGEGIKDKIFTKELPFDMKTIKVLSMVKPTEQKEIIDKLETGKAKNFREARQQITRETKQPIELPDGQFDLVYADPPWKYDFSETINREIENHYPTMEIEEIKALKVPSADNCVLFLWATAPKLLEALEVMKAWGFDYKTHAVWDKQIIGMGFWFRGQHELLLVGTKGSFSPPDSDKRISSVISIKRTEHSKKPDEIYDMLEKMFPYTRKLELFSRNLKKGWETWGNENK